MELGSRCETKPTILEWHNTADFENGTKPTILEWHNTADFENGTQPPILKWDSNKDRHTKNYENW